MFLLLLLVIIFALNWHIWRMYSPYFAFPVYFWIDWEFIKVSFRGKGPNNETLSQFFLQKKIRIIEKYAKEGMFVFWLHKPILVVYGPEPYKFLANEASLTDKPQWIYKFLAIISDRGIFRSNGKRMKKQRKIFRPLFYPGMLKEQITSMNDCAAFLVKRLRELENNITDDLIDLMKSTTLMLLLDAVLGIKEDPTENGGRIRKIIKAVDKGFDCIIYRGFRPWLHPDFIWKNFSSTGKEFSKLVKEMHHFANQIIQDLEKSYNLRNQLFTFNNADPKLQKRRNKTFGDFLMEQYLNDPSFTLEDLETELLTTIITGTDTSAESMNFTLWLLGLNQDVQEKAYEEVMSVTDEFIQYEQVLKLSYMECIIKESLRLYTVGPFYAKQTNKELHFDKYTIPSGTTIAFVPFMLHKNPEIYPEPEIFNPDRFTGNEADIKQSTLSSFAEGVRSCVGKSYAVLEMKIFIAYVLRNFKIISLTRKEDLKISWGVTVKTENSISVKFIPR